MKTQTLKPYPAYRDSGLQWLTEMPRHWNLRRGKSLFRCIDIRSTMGDEELLTVSSERGVVPRSSANVTMFKAESYVGYKLCWPRDLVINSLWAWARGLGVSRHHGIVSSAYGVYRLRDRHNSNPEFIHELVRSVPFQWELQVRSKGIWISRLQLTDESFLGAPFPMPPVPEQDAIVRFLAHADRHINRLIRAKRRLIALLNEQKQAIIHRAVTRGLDPKAPLKPSGIDRLGDIPEQWDVRRLRYLSTKFGSGLTPRGGATVYQASGVPLLRSQNVHFGELRLDDVALIPQEVHAAMAGTHVRGGDVLMNITGASIGRVCSVPIEMGEANVNQHVCIIRPIPQEISADYLAAYLSTSFIQGEVRMSQNGASREGLPVGAIKRFPIILPPRAKQEAIVDAVKIDTTELTGLIRSAMRAIDLVREYRTRLIADVVTGKLDVREAAASLFEEPDEPEDFDDGATDFEPADEAEEIEESTLADE